MQFILNKNVQNTKETLQVPSCEDASARATVEYCAVSQLARWLQLVQLSRNLLLFFGLSITF